MSKSFEVQGVIHTIGATQSFGQNGFTKREFVIKLTGEGENPTYPNYVALEVLKDKCALLDNFQLGDEVKVTFNLSGRLWSAPGKPEKCFTSLQAWRIEGATGRQDQYSQSMPDYEGPAYDQDVPF
ncbi:MAG: DUF3127 domain-containing protein [Venatoribacter sp.]